MIGAALRAGLTAVLAPKALKLALAGAAVLALLAGGWAARQSLQLAQARAALAEQRAACAAQQQAWAQQAQEAEAQQRQIEQDRQHTTSQEVARVQQDQTHDARRVAELRAAAERLRQHIAILAARAHQTGAHPAPAAGSPPTAGPGLVLADLYRGADEEAAELAQAFDRARRAGQACERIHDGLSENSAAAGKD